MTAEMIYQVAHATLKDLRNVRTWLESERNVAIKSTRFERIIKEIDFYVENFCSNPNILNERNREWVYAFREGERFIAIYKALGKFSNQILPTEKLKNIVHGPYFPNEEKSEGTQDERSHARDILFELDMAALLHDKDFVITGFNDVNFNFLEKTFAIQCKRIASEKRIGENVKTAIEQLENNQTDKKIIALSLEKVCLYNENGYQRINVDSCENLEKAFDHVDTMITEYCKKELSCLDRIKNNDILLAMLWLRFTVSFREEKKLKSFWLIQCRKFCDDKHPDNALVEELTKRINQREYRAELKMPHCAEVGPLW